jgi:hypothetical protein
MHYKALQLIQKEGPAILLALLFKDLTRSF